MKIITKFSFRFDTLIVVSIFTCLVSYRMKLFESINIGKNNYDMEFDLILFELF